MENRLVNSLIIALCSLLIACIAGCVSTPETDPNILELENKGTIMNVSTPEWLRIYLAQGISALQARSEYRDKYCIIGEESGVNRQFVLSWADAASAQQRIGMLLRTNIASRYEAAVTATAQSGEDASALYRQEIDNVLSAVVNVSYSGAQREADWWSLRRRYDPDNREIYSDEYTAWVLYTIPKAEMDRQVSFALENSVSRDSALYDVTVALARDILLQGYAENVVQDTADIQRTAADYYDPPGSITAQALNEITLIDSYHVGRDVAANILSRYAIWDADHPLTEYVNMICSAIVINSPQPVAFNGHHAAVLDSNEINAYATPGGHIFVTRGLIDAAKSEDALAAVLAHEIAHIQLNHGMRAIQTNRDLEDWFSQFNTSGAQIIMDRMNAGFSRIQEFDADITAMSLLASAGYNPLSMTDMLRELDRLQGGTLVSPATGGGFSDTHPSPASRLVNATVASSRYTNLDDTSHFREFRFITVQDKTF